MTSENQRSKTGVSVATVEWNAPGTTGERVVCQGMVP